MLLLVAQVPSPPRPPRHPLRQIRPRGAGRQPVELQVRAHLGKFLPEILDLPLTECVCNRVSGVMMSDQV